MRAIRTVAPVILGLLTALKATSAWAHEEKEIRVGRNAGGQLKPRLLFAQPVVIEESVYLGFPGYATGTLAIHSAFRDEPAEDFFELHENSNLRLILLDKEPGMEIWNSTRYMAVGDAFFIGPPYFDTHPLWNLTNGAAGNTYSLTFKLRDLAGIHAESPPFTVTFTPAVPVPIYILRGASQPASLLWPTNAVGWELQSATLVTATNWNTVTNVPAIVGTNFSLPLPIIGTQQFFRLRHAQ